MVAVTDKQGRQAWPAVTYEEHSWIPRTYDMPRRQQKLISGPYKAAIPAVIAEVERLPLPVDVLAALDEASAEISRFDAEQAAEIAPFASILLRSESAASSQIENLTASVKAIALAELGDDGRTNARLIVANTRAMQAALALADKLDRAAILNMHTALMGDTHPECTGHWRKIQVWIGGGHYGPHNAAFVPPHPTRVAPAMRDLVAFMKREDVPPLLQATVAHAQFETIHPFPDGNGRTGRALIHSLLRHKRLTRNVTVPVSAGLLTDTKAYFASLTAYREGDLATIASLVADASFRAIRNGRKLVADLHRVRQAFSDRIRVRRDAAAWRIVDLLLRQPVIDSALVKRELGVAAPNVHAAIDHLEDIGILQKIAGDRRNRRWAAPEVLAALDAFATRSIRRH